jgi:hypothetical protein
MVLRGTRSLYRWIAVTVVLLLDRTAFAQQQHCHGELPNVQREVTQTPLSTAKGAQIQALIEQVVRACKENDDVVAMAGIDQVRAILSEERKPESGS